MSNHPNRSKRPSGASSPTPDAIKEARATAGHTQTVAAATVHGTLRAWQDWESGERRMPASVFELYRLMTGQHPDFIVVDREA